MLDLTTQAVKLASVNARAELHGEDSRPAFDLKIEATLPNDALIPFDPILRSTLFKADENPDLVDQINPGQLTVLRFPKMGAIKWDWEGVGYQATVGYGIGGPSDIQLGEVKIDHFKFEPMNGGSVLITFRIIAHPETADVGKLCEFIQQSIDLTLTPPEPQSVQELFGEQKPASAKKSKKQQKENDLAEVQAALEATGDTPKKTILKPAEAWPFPTDKAA